MMLRPRQKLFVERSLAALDTHGNTLSVAPTGAGKTNVAMLTMLHEIGMHRSPTTGAVLLDAFKIVYVAPMKALVQEVVQVCLTAGGLLSSVNIPHPYSDPPSSSSPLPTELHGSSHGGVRYRRARAQRRREPYEAAGR